MISLVMTFDGQNLTLALIWPRPLKIWIYEGFQRFSNWNFRIQFTILQVSNFKTELWTETESRLKSCFDLVQTKARFQYGQKNADSGQKLDIPMMNISSRDIWGHMSSLYNPDDKLQVNWIYLKLTCLKCRMHLFLPMIFLETAW